MLRIEQEGSRDYGPCACCGRVSRMVAGLVYRDGGAHAAYQVHWTLGDVAGHGARFYVILGKWGEDAIAADRFAVAVEYRNDSEATGFRVIDSAETPIASNPLVGKALSRERVIGTPLAPEVFEVLDALWLQEDRIGEITSA